MPAEGLPWLERDEILRFEEIARLVALLGAMGVHDVRLTGGEPLVRREFPRLARDARARSRTSHELSVTTNGFLLERDAEALVRAGHRPLQRLGRLAPARPLLRADPPRRAPPGAARARAPGAASRRPTRSRSTRSRSAGSPRRRCSRSPSSRGAPRTRSASSSSCRSTPTTPGPPDQVLTGEEIRAAIDAVYPLEPEPREPQRDRARLPVRRRPRHASGSSTRSPSRSAATATAIRLTADGRLRTCLFSLNETDLRGADARRAPTTTSSSRSSATPSGARSSSTTSASPASSSRRGRCPRSAASNRRSPRKSNRPRNISGAASCRGRCCC